MQYETINAATGQKTYTTLRHVTDWLAEALAGRTIVNIGQIDAANTKRLGAAVRKGLLVSIRAPWCYIAPYGFSVCVKTHYCLPHYTRETLMAEIEAEGHTMAKELASIGIIPAPDDVAQAKKLGFK